MLAIRLDDSTEARLAALAKRTGRTKTYYVREAILRHLDNLESEFDGQRAVAEAASVYGSETLKDELGFDLRKMEKNEDESMKVVEHPYFASSDQDEPVEMVMRHLREGRYQ